jgi:sugar phosphate isomerase/epimerase
VGHARLGCGIPAILEQLKGRVRSSHIHDNKGDRDTHLWPGEGSIDWPTAMTELKSAPRLQAAVLEIHYTVAEPQESVSARMAEAFRKLEI